MNADFVVDVGNTRVKWGRVRGERIADMVSLLTGEPGAWQRAWNEWDIGPEQTWLVAGVNNQHGQFVWDWLKNRSSAVHFLMETPLVMDVDYPDKVGIDRRLNALAVKERLHTGHAAAIVDAGSAVTVDLVDETGVFRGG